MERIKLITTIFTHLTNLILQGLHQLL